MNHLAELLDETAALLEQNKDSHWAQWLRHDAQLLHRGDVSGARHFMAAFGGMGSISDYYGLLGPSKKEEDKTLDEKISDRLSKAYDWARRLSREKN